MRKLRILQQHSFESHSCLCRMTVKKQTRRKKWSGEILLFLFSKSLDDVWLLNHTKNDFHGDQKQNNSLLSTRILRRPVVISSIGITITRNGNNAPNKAGTEEAKNERKQYGVHIYIYTYIYYYSSAANKHGIYYTTPLHPPRNGGPSFRAFPFKGASLNPWLSIVFSPGLWERGLQVIGRVFPVASNVTNTGVYSDYLKRRRAAGEGGNAFISIYTASLPYVKLVVETESKPTLEVYGELGLALRMGIHDERLTLQTPFFEVY